MMIARSKQGVLIVILTLLAFYFQAHSTFEYECCSEAPALFSGERYATLSGRPGF